MLLLTRGRARLLRWYYKGATPKLSQVLIGPSNSTKKLLNDTSQYTVAMSSYQANGGDDYAMLATNGVPAPGVVVENLGVALVDVAMECASCPRTVLEASWKLD